MKIRIKGNSLRLRLVRNEVQRLANEGVVREVIEFGGDQRLGYSIEIDRSVAQLCARFENGAIRVLVPPDDAQAWVATDIVSLVGDQPLEPGEALQLLVEKDFTCLNPRAIWQEDQSDNFLNPNPSCGPSHV